jgi:hypothetical protein
MFKNSYLSGLVVRSLVLLASGALMPGVSNAKGTLAIPQDTTQLMEIAFPASKSIAGSDARLLDTDSAPVLRETADGSVESSERITPLGRIVQDPSHVALITARARSNEEGVIQAAHPDQAVIGAYLFSRRQNGWRLVTRADNVVSAGFFGALDSIEVTRISATTHAISILSSSCWQGYCGTWLTVIGLGSNHIEVWGDGIRLAANDIAAKEECAGALRKEGAKISSSSPLPVDETASGGAASDTSEGASDQCFSITGRYAFSGISWRDVSTPPDLILSFKGLVAPTSSGPAGQGTCYAVKSVAIYKLRDGQYRLFAGANPVPGF